MSYNNFTETVIADLGFIPTKKDGTESLGFTVVSVTGGKFAFNRLNINKWWIDNRTGQWATTKYPIAIPASKVGEVIAILNNALPHVGGQGSAPQYTPPPPPMQAQPAQAGYPGVGAQAYANRPQAAPAQPNFPPRAPSYPQPQTQQPVPAMPDYAAPQQQMAPPVPQFPGMGQPLPYDVGNDDPF